MSLPDFLIAGVPKAGTTALRSALRQHPEFYLPKIKEPKLFLTGDWTHVVGRAGADRRPGARVRGWTAADRRRLRALLALHQGPGTSFCPHCAGACPPP